MDSARSNSTMCFAVKTNSKATTSDENKFFVCYCVAWLASPMISANGINLYGRAAHNALFSLNERRLNYSCGKDLPHSRQLHQKVSSGQLRGLSPGNYLIMDIPAPISLLHTSFSPQRPDESLQLSHERLITFCEISTIIVTEMSQEMLNSGPATGGNATPHKGEKIDPVREEEKSFQFLCHVDCLRHYSYYWYLDYDMRAVRSKSSDQTSPIRWISPTIFQHEFALILDGNPHIKRC